MTTRVDDDRVARIVIDWITGSRGPVAHAVFCADPRVAHTAAALLDDTAVVLMPESAGRVETRALVVPYSGALDEVGDTLHVGGRSVELQHYLAAAYVELIVPTVVRFLDADGWSAFLDDADLARRTGVFSSAVVDPRLRLGDGAVLHAPFATQRPGILHVHGDGQVTAGPQGGVLGEVDDLARILDTPVPRLIAFAGLSPLAALHADVARRPWLGRYLRAAELAGLLGARGGRRRIDGFGQSSIVDERADANPASDDPFLVETDDGILLADPRTRRRQLLSTEAATVVAAMQTSSTLEFAIERCRAALGITTANARALCAEAGARLGVHVGVSATTAGAPS
ncbi:hypothetical protein IFU08_02085 [Microbacterium sp. CFBP 8790]|uniref:daptide biosynthesis RiPP recognition protein n=1 Tax=unclassified Microbacterium TaxID=2609290 RepID=UPI00177AB966|nr:MULTISPECIES: daptide biosynthesis RiPP recognition protein [unclassified Microbacterium]MBD8206450.1 hypothetical protein [Microbacterium sp. CFBP 8801]MBD8508354.1 hypothetical protein [Microbacterium sp. CFBP 8790]